MEGAGGHKFGREDGLPCNLYATNLTLDSDKETGIGNWTPKQIEAAVRFGQGQGGRQLSPVMPWMLYNGMSQEDMDSLVAYLQTVKAVKAPPKQEVKH